MDKKIVFWILCGMAILCVAFLSHRGWENRQGEPLDSGQPLYETESSTDNPVIESAKAYILEKPQLYLNEEKISWDDAKLDGRISPEWIISQEVTVQKEADGSHAVQWFFIPGCEADPKSDDEPNWFNKEGLRCLGGYTLTVTVSGDNMPIRAELSVLN